MATKVVEKKLVLTQVFNLKEFIGKGWKIEEEDPRSLAIKEVEPEKFLFETCLREGESWITGEVKLIRLKEKSDFIPFNSNVFLGLWEDYQVNKKNSVLEWLFLNKGVKCMDFFATRLRSPSGRRFVLCLYRLGAGFWLWDFYWLGRDWDVSPPSVGCASSLISEA